MLHVVCISCHNNSSVWRWKRRKPSDRCGERKIIAKTRERIRGYRNPVPTDIIPYRIPKNFRYGTGPIPTILLPGRVQSHKWEPFLVATLPCFCYRSVRENVTYVTARIHPPATAVKKCVTLSNSNNPSAGKIYYLAELVWFYLRGHPSYSNATYATWQPQQRRRY